MLAALAEIDALLARHSTKRPANGSSDPAPAAPAAEGEGGTIVSAAATAPRPRTIVLVDDNNDYRALIKSLLESSAYEVIEAANGALALPLILRAQPDLVIVDFNMPKMNGYELIEQIRSRAETRAIPIIMFTGAANRRHLRTMDMGVADFLEKPVPNKTFLRSVAKALGLAESEPPPAPEAVPPGPMVIERVTSFFEKPARPAPPPPLVLPPVAEEPTIQEVPPEGLGSPPEELSEAEAAALEVLDSEEKQHAQEELGLEKLANDSPLVARVNRILLQAVDAKASDIHIEPQEKHVTVRLRVDGALKHLCSLPLGLHPRLTARVKIMSNLVITERRLPQDGQFRAQIKGRKIEFRVSTLPCTYGEKIVLRILGQSKLQGSLSQLALTDRERASVEKALKSPHGLILVTGPTGSGKTTTLYTMINVLNRPDVNIMTAEDPVEYEVADISQVKIRPAIGLTFESVLRAFLRQDPDIMLIGEIRDLETAEIAVKASITGHLVFSTLHTNSAPATIVRLAHMGVAPYLVAASVKLVIAQRLIRVLCDRCKAPAAPSVDDRKFLTEEEIGLLARTYRRVGCAECRQTGYAGRRPVFEVLPMEGEMRRLVCEGAGLDALNAAAAAQGMTALRRAAMQCVAEGRSSLEDAFKIVLAD